MRLVPAVLLLILLAAASPPPAARVVERVTTIAPYPRGLAMVDGELFVLCRGRVRGVGGVSAAIDDQAGTIYAVDPDGAEPLRPGAAVGEAIRANGRIVARPTAPPFRLWNRASDPPERDRETDRPYCTLRYHEATRSFYLCAFSGVDKRRTPDDPVAFSKNLSDALFRYDLRTAKWYEIERHDIEAGGNYPHHDPDHAPPPHGWLNGPDNCLPVGDGLYAVSKDNTRLVRYDLAPLIDDPDAGYPDSEVILTDRIHLRGVGERSFHGMSALANNDGWLYIGYRTSSVIVRVPLDDDGRVKRPITGELVARFDPYDPTTGRSANLTDMAFDERGRLYVISAQPARVYRFTPDPKRVFDARDDRVEPWADMAALTGNPTMKSENLLVHGDWLYITSGDGYAYQAGADGTVYRVHIDD
ncbi:MAG: hypothetical protein ACF8PN_04555 [Phycisphaerales bacterium]